MIIPQTCQNESGLKHDKVVAAAAAESSKTKHEAKWSMKECIALQLVASRIAKGHGIIQDEGMKISDIESATILSMLGFTIYSTAPINSPTSSWLNVFL
jgi:hypothetical protein